MKTSSDKEKKWTEWFEIPVTDMERAKGFYETVFETDIFLNDLGPNFKMGLSPHKDVGCALCWAPEFYKPSMDGICVYLNANPDLQPTLDRIEAAGGQVISPKKQIDAEHGHMALFIDSEGSRLALHSTE
jgi:hypothetical protein